MDIIKEEYTKLMNDYPTTSECINGKFHKRVGEKMHNKDELNDFESAYVKLRFSLKFLRAEREETIESLEFYQNELKQLEEEKLILGKNEKMKGLIEKHEERIKRTKFIVEEYEENLRRKDKVIKTIEDDKMEDFGIDLKYIK